MQNNDGLDMSLSSISILSRSCSDLVQQHNATFKDLEQKILNFYLQKQVELPARKTEGPENKGSSDEGEDDDNDSIEQSSFEKPKSFRMTLVPSIKKNEPPITEPVNIEVPQKLTGELEYKRSRIFLEVNRWRVS